MSNQNNQNQNQKNSDKTQQSAANTGTEVSTAAGAQAALQPAPLPTTITETATAAANTDGLNAEEVGQLALLSQILGEYGPAAGMHIDMRKDSSKTVMAKLHHAFRVLFSLRGEAFQKGFTAFIEAINENKNKAYHPKVVNSHLNLIVDTAEAGVFVTFVNYAIRFARVQNKQNFSKNNDVSRLTERLSDADLVSALNHAFLVNK